eukprot:5736547-Pleurochrysis_carterae.AAC.1
MRKSQNTRSRSCFGRSKATLFLLLQRAATGRKLLSCNSTCLLCNRPVRLALYGQSNLKSVGSPEAVPLGSAPPASGIVTI